MANQDRVNFIWGENALTTIPPVPVSEIAYRDTTQTPEQMAEGQKYDTIYNSARYNQMFYLVTAVAKTLCENGMMPFLTGQAYAHYARCIYTDGKIYVAQRAIEADESPFPTPGDESNVWLKEGGGGGNPAGAVVPFCNVTLGGPGNRYPIFWGTSEYDPGWLLCDGGGDGRGGTVPNLQERFILGVTKVNDIGNTGGGYSANVTGTISSTTAGGTVSSSTTVAANTGNPNQALSIAATNVEANTNAVQPNTYTQGTTISAYTMPSHTHVVYVKIGASNGQNWLVGQASNHDLTDATGAAGGSQAHNHGAYQDAHSHYLTANSHSHTLNNAAHTHGIPALTVNAPSFTGTAHTHTFTGSAAVTAPPYYALCYFVKLPE